MMVSCQIGLILWAYHSDNAEKLVKSSIVSISDARPILVYR